MSKTIRRRNSYREWAAIDWRVRSDNLDSGRVSPRVKEECAQKSRAEKRETIHNILHTEGFDESAVFTDYALCSNRYFFD